MSISAFVQVCLQYRLPGAHESGQWDCVEFLEGILTRAHSAAEFGDSFARQLLDQVQFERYSTVRCMLDGCMHNSVPKRLKNERACTVILPLQDVKGDAQMEKLLIAKHQEFQYDDEYRCSRSHATNLTELRLHMASLPDALLVQLGRFQDNRYVKLVSWVCLSDRSVLVMYCISLVC